MNNITTLERDVRAVQGDYINGVPEARDLVWRTVWPVLRRRAARAGIPWDDAGDVAMDAIFYVDQYVQEVEAATVLSLMALFNNALNIYILRYKTGDGSPEVLDGDLVVPGSEEEDEEIDPLLAIEEARMRTGGVPHEWLTVINVATPEDELVTENLLQMFERRAVESCGQEAWDAYYANVVLGHTQAAIADNLGVSQQRISQLIKDVQDSLLGTVGM